MAVVINVMCIFKDVGGDDLTAVQGANTLTFGPVYLLSTECIKMMDLESLVTFKHRWKGFKLDFLQAICRVCLVKSVSNPAGLIKKHLQFDQIHLHWDVNILIYQA